MAKAAAGAASSGAGAADEKAAGKGTIAGGDEGAAGKGGAADKGDKGGAGAGKAGAAADAVEDGDEGDAGDGGAGDKGGDGGKGGDKGGKPDKGGKGAKAQTGGKDGDTPEVPEKYALKLPKGADVWIDDKDLKTFEKVARAKGLTNEQAQAEITERAEFMATQSSAFYDQTAEDDTYGGDKLEETETLARAALDKLRPKGTPRGDALRRMLVKTGYGNNLEIVSFLADLGKMMAEDKGAGSSSGATLSETAAEKLYGKTTSNTPAPD